MLQQRVATTVWSCQTGVTIQLDCFEIIFCHLRYRENSIHKQWLVCDTLGEAYSSPSCIHIRRLHTHPPVLRTRTRLPTLLFYHAVFQLVSASAPHGQHGNGATRRVAPLPFASPVASEVSSWFVDVTPVLNLLH